MLLLGVTRIQTSPAPTRRPCSLALTPHDLQSRPALVEGLQVRRNSLSSGRRVVIRRNSSRKREARHYCQVSGKAGCGLYRVIHRRGSYVLERSWKLKKKNSHKTILLLGFQIRILNVSLRFWITWYSLQIGNEFSVGNNSCKIRLCSRGGK